MDKNIWEKDEYYKAINNTHQNDLINKDPIFLRFIELIEKNNVSSILDVGCGEGWLIDQISRQLSGISFTGIDVSTFGVERANKRNINNAKFSVYGGEAFPFPGQTFDVVLSSFVFEHLSDPMGTFNEMNRVVKKSGSVIIVCPNFGSPLFRSPCNKNNRILLMISRFFKELRPKLFFKNNFFWDFTDPIELPPNVHISDYDTICEPNLSSFEKFLVSNKDKYSILDIGSLWDSYDYKEIAASKNPSFLRKLLVHFVRFLGLNKILRFQYFGSFFFVAIKKL